MFHPTHLDQVFPGKHWGKGTWLTEIQLHRYWEQRRKSLSFFILLRLGPWRSTESSTKKRRSSCYPFPYIVHLNFSLTITPRSLTLALWEGLNLVFKSWTWPLWQLLNQNLCLVEPLAHYSVALTSRSDAPLLPDDVTLPCWVRKRQSAWGWPRTPALAFSQWQHSSVWKIYRKLIWD